MNISEFEQQLRDDDLPGPYRPDEDKWRKLEAELHPPRRNVFFFPATRKVMLAAAGMALLIAAGLFTIIDHSENDNHELVTQVKPNAGKAGVMVDAVTNDTQANSNPPTTIQSINSKSSLPVQQQNLAGKPTNDPFRNQDHSVDRQLPETPLTSETPGQEPQDIAVTHPPRTTLPISRENANSQNKDDHFFDNGDERERATRHISFGVAALYGFSPISISQYNLGLNANTNISDMLFASVQVMATGARISVTVGHEYQAVALGPKGAAPEKRIKEVAAVYTGNIYTVGISPSIGVHLTKRFSVSAGPDLKKSLSTAVPLSNEDQFTNQINSQSLVDNKQSVSGVDMGLQSTAQLNVNRKMAVNLLYRYGLTNYLKTTNGNARNSFFCIGLSYNIK